MKGGRRCGWLEFSQLQCVTRWEKCIIISVETCLTSPPCSLSITDHSSNSLFIDEHCWNCFNVRLLKAVFLASVCLTLSVLCHCVRAVPFLKQYCIFILLLIGYGLWNMISVNLWIIKIYGCADCGGNMSSGDEQYWTFITSLFETFTANYFLHMCNHFTLNEVCYSSNFYYQLFFIEFNYSFLEL